MKCHAKSAAIHANVGRQKAPEHMALAGVARVSNVAKRLGGSSIVIHGFGEWVPSSEPAVARSPCPSEASWRATDERQRRQPTVPLLVGSERALGGLGCRPIGFPLPQYGVHHTQDSPGHAHDRLLLRSGVLLQCLKYVPPACEFADQTPSRFDHGPSMKTVLSRPVGECFRDVGSSSSF